MFNRLKLKDNTGSIGVALVVVLIAVMSGITFAAIGFNDTVSFRFELDGLQQLHVLRSEVGRGRLVASIFEDMHEPPPVTYLPERSVEVEFGNHRTVYSTRTRLETVDSYYDKGYMISSLISATRGVGRVLSPENKSPVKRYGENRIKSLQTLALFHYFSDIDRHIDDVPGGIVFWSGDIIHGRLHSNTDIYMRNNDWPRFYGLVSTSGMVRVSPGGGTHYPREQIFLGPAPSLIENYPRIAFDPTADLVRSRGRQLFGGSERDDAIAYVTVDGSAYDLMLGVIVVEEDPPDEWIEGYNQFTIYDMHPPYGPVGQRIGVNRIPKRDTIWTHESGGTLVNSSMFVPMELWISGDFQGRQTWASSHNIYLKDDLTYRNTLPGQRPDGRDNQGNYVGNPNTTDYLGVISEESIYIQYGHWNPIDSVRVRPNTEHIYMYGAYCAVGQGDHPWHDGLITIQYLYPKGSTPPQYSMGEYFQFVDLHLFHYPTTSIRPWPPGLDYPWYNPLWPEPGPIYGVPGLPAFTPNPHDAPVVVQIRGNIWLFGSFAQRRRGAVGVLSGGVIPRMWNIDGEINPNIVPTYGTVPPGRTGYEKMYTTDLRFERTGPPHFPIIRFEGYESEELKDLGYLTLSWQFRNPPSNF